MIAIVDYDAGNLRSVEKAFASLGVETVITRDEAAIKKADKIVLPGVGSFGHAMENLDRYRLISVLKEVTAKEIPLLGICLGLQILFEDSEETPGINGLGLLKGHIVRIPEKKEYKIPHIGWNSIAYPNKGRLFQGIREESYVYFVHSYYLQAENPGIVTAKTVYTVPMDTSVECGQIFGCQFHPEKSSTVGLQILKNFAEL